MIQRVQSTDAPDPISIQRRANYEAARDRLHAESLVLRSRWNLLGNARLVLFAAAVAALLAALQTGMAIFYGLTALALIAFIVLIVRHRRLGYELRRVVGLRDINQESLWRGERAWNDLPLRHTFPALTAHPFANDLDLFGHASLFHLLDTTETPMGAARLREWLLTTPPAVVVRERQELIGGVTTELEWRQELAVRGRLAGDDHRDPGPLLDWAEGPLWLASHLGVRLAGLLGPLLFWASVAAAAFDLIPSFACIVIFGINILISQSLAAEARIRIGLVADHVPAITPYSRLLEQIESLPGDSAGATRFRERILTAGARPSELVGLLGRRASFAVPIGTLLYLPLQGLFAWDINVLASLESWQRLAGKRLRGWLEQIGEIEAVSSLATIAYDQPGWVSADQSPEHDRFTALGLGHPLLPDGQRVTNDVEVGPTGKFLLVTGSNMSGKSTLLRAIGINLVLAAAGGPVCATALRTPPVQLWTSVRVEDSLERGVSFFMAELQRLKQVVDAADAAVGESRRVFYLLDEILQGTNTAERQIAARRIIRHLVDRGAIGAVSTHDLTLAEGPELESVAIPVHLRDTVTGSGMTFDYRLRPGIATSSNALRLMQIVFGDLDASEDQAGA